MKPEEVSDIIERWVNSMKYKSSGSWGKKGEFRYDIDLIHKCNRDSLAELIIQELKNKRWRIDGTN